MKFPINISRGAYAMATQGKDYLDILTFYFPGVEIY